MPAADRHLATLGRRYSVFPPSLNQVYAGTGDSAFCDPHWRQCLLTNQALGGALSTIRPKQREKNIIFFLAELIK